jgi:hypothetical protein
MHLGKQLPATIPFFDISEFCPMALKSFTHRRIETGHPYTTILEHYRMRPHISRLVNMLVYDNRLIENPCTFGHDNADLFDRWSKVMEYDAERRALFCEVLHPELYVERDGFSKLGLNYGHQRGAIRDLQSH